MYACRFVVDHCCNWLLRFCLFSKKVINFDNASDQDQKKVAEDLESRIL